MTNLKRKILSWALVLLFVLAFIPFGMFSVSAGESKQMTNNSSITESGINSGSWYYKNVSVVDSHVVFDGLNGILTAKTAINSLEDYDLEHCFDGELTLTFNTLLGNGLGIGIGVDKVNFSTGFNGAFELRFTNKNSKVNLDVKLNSADGTSSESLGSKTFDFNEPVNLKIILTSYGDFKVLTDNDEVITDKKDSGVVIGGYFGFQSNLGTIATLNSIDTTFYRYENATTVTEATENFDNGFFNANVWYTSNHVYPEYPVSTTKIENGQLVILNSYENYISTIHQYSNFEFMMDIVDFRRATYVEDGIEYRKVRFFGFGFGLADYMPYYSQIIQNELWFEFDSDNNRYILFDEDRGGVYSAYDIQPFANGYNLWSEEDVKDRTINLKITMLNGVFSVYTKYEDEQWGNPVFSYDMGYTPLGSVAFTSSNWMDYIVIDNLSIKNLDYNAEDFAVSVDYKKNITTYEPIEYVDTWDDADLLKEGTEMKQGCSSFIAGDTIAVSIVFVSFGLALIALKKKESK